MKYLVTGATGFIGTELCRQLRANGEEVVAVSRSGDVLPDGAATLALDFAVGELDGSVLEGVDTVFHLAGIAHTRAAVTEYERVNFRATADLAELARAAGVRCFVFLSSVKAMGPVGSSGARSETDVTLPADPYGLSKWHAETALREAGQGSAMATVILRPALVYDQQAKGNLALLAKAAHYGLPRPPSAGARSMIARADLVSLMVSLPELELAGVNTWIVADGQHYTARRVFDALRCADEASPGIAWLPGWCWRMAAGLYDLGRGDTVGTTSAKLFAEELYSNAAVMGATGWQPLLTLEAVLQGRIVPAGDMHQ